MGNGVGGNDTNARRLLELGAHGLVLSGGFVSRAPMYVMRGAMPIRSMAYYMVLVAEIWRRMFGKWMIPTVPFKRGIFSRRCAEVP